MENLQKDSLTQFYQEKSFLNLLGQEMARAKRYTRSLAVLAIILHVEPLDLKRDAQYPLLRKVGKIVRELIRSLDIPGRFGENLFVALPETTEEGAKQIAQRIVQEINAIESYANNAPIKVSSAIGIAMFPQEAETVNKLVGAAKDALDTKPIR